MKNTNVYVVEVKSESGDDYGAYIFSKEPTNKQLEKFFRKEMPEEFDLSDGEGPGEWGSYILISGPYEQKIIDIDKIMKKL